jgi:hypothetical protein
MYLALGAADSCSRRPSGQAWAAARASRRVATHACEGTGRRTGRELSCTASRIRSGKLGLHARYWLWNEQGHVFSQHIGALSIEQPLCVLRDPDQSHGHVVGVIWDGVR